MSLEARLFGKHVDGVLLEMDEQGLSCSEETAPFLISLATSSRNAESRACALGILQRSEIPASAARMVPALLELASRRRELFGLVMGVLNKLSPDDFEREFLRCVQGCCIESLGMCSEIDSVLRGCPVLSPLAQERCGALLESMMRSPVFKVVALGIRTMHLLNPDACFEPSLSIHQSSEVRLQLKKVTKR
jgi:hypothetical protein